jgi:putative lipoprotein (rSAM/lipoprotein system)
MKVRFNRWYNALLTALLAMLGYESCTQHGLDEYGTPTVDYQVKGFVTDLLGTPIQGIKVRAPYSYIDGSEGQSVLTDENGRFELDEFHSEYNDKLIVEDIDGEDNGGDFMSDTIKVRDLPKKEVEKGDGSWYMGKYEVSAKIKLKLKEK